MNKENEKMMKDRGEAKVWKNVLNEKGNYKTIASTQVGQKLLLEESLRILPLVRKWIEEDCAKVYRASLRDYFKDDDILLEKTLLSFLFIAGQVSDASSTKATRHKRIKTLQQRVTPELTYNLTWRFIEVIIDYSEYFSTEKVLHIDKNAFHWNIKYTCNLSHSILNKLTIEAAVAFYPLPMLEAPVDWEIKEGKIVGGYSNYQYEMVRAGLRKVDYSLYKKEVFDSVNYIQSTPWIINEEILEAVKNDLKVPQKKDYVLTQFPSKEEYTACMWEIDLKDKKTKVSKASRNTIEEARAFYKERSALYTAEVGDFESEMGKYRAVKLATQVADKYVGKDVYFPHNFDFRGRVYPLAIGLSPQGSDPVKAILQFKNEIAPTESGMKWNWSYLASLFGDDKIPFEERIVRGKELLHADYKEADEPYQFLAHQRELQKWVEDSNYIPNTRIQLDACNSGSQFTSVITGDKFGCEATNVFPTISEDGVHSRQDAYLLVAERALELTNNLLSGTSDEDEIHSLSIFKNLLETKGRKICKTPVMVSNYGGTTGGRTEILWNMFRELGVERKDITRGNAAKLSKIIGDSIQGVLNGGKAFETYIHQMNNVVTKNGEPITWSTGDGFHVVHVKNKELAPKKVSCVLPNSRKSTVIIKKVYSDKINASKMKSAISPNFIHSLDAELLRRVALKMKEQGIDDSSFIHDSFGSHPNHIGEVLSITKREFIKLAQADPLMVLDLELRAQAPEDKKLKKILDKIEIPNLGGFDLKSLKIEEVMKSNWFFS